VCDGHVRESIRPVPWEMTKIRKEVHEKIYPVFGIDPKTMHGGDCAVVSPVSKVLPSLNGCILSCSASEPCKSAVEGPVLFKLVLHVKVNWREGMILGDR